MGSRHALATAVAALALAAPAHAAPTAVYQGDLIGADGKPVAPMVIEARGAKIKRIVLQYHASCQSGYQLATHGALVNRGKPPAGAPQSITIGRTDLYAGPISKKGKFAAKLFGSVDIRSTDVLANVGGAISGKLTKTGGKGTFKTDVIIAPVLDHSPTPEDAANVDPCTSGTLHWTVRRGPAYFGGATQQGEPVTAIVDRGKVAQFVFGWTADNCGGPGTWQDTVDEEDAFVISKTGTFGETRDYPFSNPDGTSELQRYDVEGKIGKSGGQGILWAMLQGTDAAGNPTGSACTTPNIPWKLASG